MRTLVLSVASAALAIIVIATPAYAASGNSTASAEAITATKASTPTPPDVVVKQTINTLLKRMDGHRDELRKHPKQLYELVEQVLMPSFDIDYMAQLILGRTWSETWRKTTRMAALKITPETETESSNYWDHVFGMDQPKAKARLKAKRERLRKVKRKAQRDLREMRELRKRFIRVLKAAVVRSYASNLLKYNKDTVEFKPPRRAGKRVIIGATAQTHSGNTIPMSMTMHLSDGQWKAYNGNPGGFSSIAFALRRAIDGDGLKKLIERLEQRYQLSDS